MIFQVLYVIIQVSRGFYVKTNSNNNNNYTARYVHLFLFTPIIIFHRDTFSINDIILKKKTTRGGSMPRYLCVLFESKVNENSAARGVIQPDDCIHIYLYVYIFIYRYVPPSCFTKETFSTSRNHTGGRTARAVESNYSYGNGGRNARKEQCAPRDCNTAAPSPPRSASPHYRKPTFPSLPSPPLPPR